MTSIAFSFADLGAVAAAVMLTLATILAARRFRIGRTPAAVPVALGVMVIWSLARSLHLPLVPDLLWHGVAMVWIVAVWQLRVESGLAAKSAATLHAALMVAILCAILLTIARPNTAIEASAAFDYAEASLRGLTAVGMVFLVYHLHVVESERTTTQDRGWLFAGLSALFAYAFLAAFCAMTFPTVVDAIEDGFGWYVLGIAFVMALSFVRFPKREFRLSRRMTMTSAMALVLVLYLCGLVAAVSAAALLPSVSARLVQIAIVFTLTVAALVVLPSARFRAWMKVEVAKHLFSHRYDYRSEWLRFTQTMSLGRGAERDMHQIERSVVLAMAQLIDATGGHLVSVDSDGRLMGGAHWQWPRDRLDLPVLSAEGLAEFGRTGWIVDLGDHDQRRRFGFASDWTDRSPAWIAVPLVHFDALVAVLLLGPPLSSRSLDWEDLDILRVASRHAASVLSEARQIAARAEAERFEEFSRRFAFIMHDIKNMVSQMSVLARNAERHADNPEFRADMILTLKDTAGRMSDMIARLNRGERPKSRGREKFNLRPVLAAMARSKAVRWDDQAAATSIAVVGDRYAIEQAIGHIIQNAVDAATPDGVRVSFNVVDSVAEIVVADNGPGMTATFVRDELFRPFSSTKLGGFGIGAHEARTILRHHGGEVHVESQPGRGARFTLSLPVISEEGTQPRSATG